MAIDHTMTLYWEIKSACDTVEGLAGNPDERPETDRRRGLGLCRFGRTHEGP